MRALVRLFMLALLPLAGLVVSSVSVSATSEGPFATVTGCTVTFGNVPEGDHVVILQGETVVADPADNPATLPSGTYSWEVRSATTEVGNNYQQFTILPGCPPPTFTTTCGGSVTFHGVPSGWRVVIKNDEVVSEVNDTDNTADLGPIPLNPGSYSYAFIAQSRGNFPHGSFVITACPSPPPCGSEASAARCPSPPPTVGLPNTGVPVEPPVFWPFIVLAVAALVGVGGRFYFRHHKS